MGLIKINHINYIVSVILYFVRSLHILFKAKIEYSAPGLCLILFYFAVVECFAASMFSCFPQLICH